MPSELPLPLRIQSCILRIFKYWIAQRLARKGFLTHRDLYSYQLKNYVEDNGLQQNSTCMIYFSENRKKLEKEATKILSKYKRNRNTTVTRIDTDKFHFIKPEE